MRGRERRKSRAAKAESIDHSSGNAARMRNPERKFRSG